ncbi:hypothetical protein J2851_003615 [Azospirillum rugosum]|uniref:Transposase n=1 Tax=Azospirillum rugosum TaxID=416170 RepID=A0ABS4SR10_9PROT|nr:hypothetical protein [Azospirillum rugosum]MDQ0526983.1 hypothetical protein [Azospirillum rugosum]
MSKKSYSMPDARDRTDYERLRKQPAEAIDVTDIPPLDSPVWSGETAPPAVSRPAARIARTGRR